MLSKLPHISSENELFIFSSLHFYLRLFSHSFLVLCRNCLLPYAPFRIVLGMIILDPLELRHTCSGRNIRTIFSRRGRQATDVSSLRLYWL